MDIHTGITEFVMALLGSSTLLIELVGLILAQLRFSPNLSTNSSIARFLRRALSISIVFGIAIFMPCSVGFVTRVDNIIYVVLAVFWGQLYFFIRPVIRYAFPS